jgi:hypothetical protein
LNEGKDLKEEEKTHMDKNKGEDSLEAKLNNKRMIGDLEICELVIAF